MKDRFRELRKVLGLSQNQLEDILELKTDPKKKSSAITKYERGEIQPSSQVLRKLASEDFKKKTGKQVNINWLLTGEGEMFLPDAPVPREEREIPDEFHPPHKGREFYLRKSHYTELIEKVGNSTEDVKEEIKRLGDAIITRLDQRASGESPGDLRAGLAQLPGEASARKHSDPVNWKAEVISLAKKGNRRKDPIFSLRHRKPKVALPVGAGKMYIAIEDLFSDEDVEFDWLEPVDYVVSVKGSSMEPFIHDGSDIYVKKYDFIEVWCDNGDIAVVHVDDKQEYMVRRLWFHQRDNIIDIGLQSENPKGIEWHFWKDTEDESTYSMVKLLGKVVGPNI